jgi:hypothetical protein
LAVRPRFGRPWRSGRSFSTTGRGVHGTSAGDGDESLPRAAAVTCAWAAVVATRLNT